MTLKVKFPHFWTPPHCTNSQNSIIAFNNTLFLAQKLSKFVSLPWKLHNRYCHNEHTSLMMLIWFSCRLVLYWLIFTLHLPIRKLEFSQLLCIMNDLRQIVLGDFKSSFSSSIKYQLLDSLKKFVNIGTDWIKWLHSLFVDKESQHFGFYSLDHLIFLRRTGVRA